MTLAAQAHPDIVLLDLGMPHLDGIRVIEALRGWTDAPIIVVSGRTGSADKVDALDAGADDYVTKPFQVDELLARLRALARRSTPSAGASADPVVRFGDVTVDLAAKIVTRAGAPVHLTPTEWRMLEFLARHPGALVTRQTLLKDIWGTEQVADTGYLRLYVSELRKKLENLGVEGVLLLGVAKGVERRAGHEALVLPDGREIRPGAASPALQFIQQVRDEAHRFAITGHRGRRQKARMTSRLEDIPGIGPRRRASLLKHFGGLAGLKAAGEAEIARVEGINAALATRIYANLHGLSIPDPAAE